MKFPSLILLLACAFSASAQSTNRPAKAKTLAVKAAPALTLGQVQANAAIAANSKRIVLLEKKINEHTAKDNAADTLLRAREAAGKISNRNAKIERAARHKATKDQIDPLKIQIGEIRLRDLELRRFHKLPEPKR